MTWVRRRRHSFGPIYIDTNRFWPTSWGFHAGRETYNVTRRRNSLRLPFGLGAWQTGGRRRRR